MAKRNPLNQVQTQKVQLLLFMVLVAEVRQHCLMQYIGVYTEKKIKS